MSTAITPPLYNLLFRPYEAGPSNLREICQIKKYNGGESGPFSVVIEYSGAKSHALFSPIVFLTNRIQPRERGPPAGRETKAVVTICNINLIGLTLSSSHRLPDYLCPCFNAIALIAPSEPRPPDPPPPPPKPALPSTLTHANV